MISDIRASMELKSTDDLVEIWTQNDHTQWTNVAFGVVADLLLERLGSLPEQRKPIDDPADANDAAQQLLVDYDEKQRIDSLLVFILYACFLPAIGVVLGLIIALIGRLSHNSTVIVERPPWFFVLAAVCIVPGLIFRRHTKAAAERAKRDLLAVVSKGLMQ